MLPTPLSTPQGEWPPLLSLMELLLQDFDQLGKTSIPLRWMMTQLALIIRQLLILRLSNDIMLPRPKKSLITNILPSWHYGFRGVLSAQDPYKLQRDTFAWLINCIMEKSSILANCFWDFFMKTLAKLQTLPRISNLVPYFMLDLSGFCNCG